MNRLLLALLLAAACKHSTSSSSTSHSETSTVTDSTSSETGTQTTVTTTSEAPGKTVTVVEEYAPPTENETSPGTSALAQSARRPDGRDGTSAAHSAEVAGSSPAGGPLPGPSHGPLVRRTVTTTEHGEKDTTARQEATQQGTAATETRAQASGDVKTAKASETKPAASCIGASWLWGAAVLAGIVGVLYFAIKMRKSVV